MINHKHAEIAKNIQALIKQVLIEYWDPIGISYIPEANDEYDAYVSSIYKMLVSNKNAAELFDYLWWVETKHMEVCGDRQRTENVVSKILELLPVLNCF